MGSSRNVRKVWNGLGLNAVEGIVLLEVNETGEFRAEEVEVRL